MAIPDKIDPPVKVIVTKEKLTAIANKTREKTGLTTLFLLDDIPSALDNLEQVSTWEGTRDESNASTDVTEDNYNVVTNKNKVTFNTAQQKMENVLNVYFTTDIYSTADMSQILSDEAFTVNRVYRYMGETEVYVQGKYYRVTESGDFEEVQALKLEEVEVTPTESTQELTPSTEYNGIGKVVVKPIPSTHIVPSGTVELTTLGEHDVTQYAKANVNVPASAFEDSIYEELNNMTFGEGE